MKRFIVFALALLSGMGMNLFAQEKSQYVVTLQHGDSIQAFYGESAFKAAYDAAEHGDIITLPPTEFAGFDIEKAITIRAASYRTSRINTNNVDFRIAVPDSINNLSFGSS